jgi:hypothetical protein
MYQASGVLPLLLLLRQLPHLDLTSVLRLTHHRIARLRRLALGLFSKACYLMVPPWLLPLQAQLLVPQDWVTPLSVPCLRIGLNQNRNLKLNQTLRGVVPRHPAQEVHPLRQRLPRNGFNIKYCTPRGSGRSHAQPNGEQGDNIPEVQDTSTHLSRTHVTPHSSRPQLATTRRIAKATYEISHLRPRYTAIAPPFAYCKVRTAQQRRFHTPQTTTRKVEVPRQ